MFPLKIYQAISINAARGAACGYLGINLIELSLKFVPELNEEQFEGYQCNHQISWLIGLAIIMIIGALINLFIACTFAKIYDMQDYVPLRFSHAINHADFCFSIAVLVFSFFMLIGFNENCGRFSELVHFYLLFFWIPLSFFASLIGLYIIFKCDYSPLLYELSLASHQELTTTFGQWETL